MKSVLITGGTGSFGHAVVERLLSLPEPPERIIVYSRDEQKQEQMARQFQHSSMRFFIGDVRDESRLVMATRDVDVILHAAALKIVPIAEYNPFEVVQTNIHGAENVVRAAIKSGVQKVLALSTDKAVNPINLYGATKLAAEKIFVAANNLSAGTGPLFSVVRYGNVVGSRGSVIPLFKSLVDSGKNITITDNSMTRFWIEMNQVIDFALLSLDQMVGREIFIPKIPSIWIKDLALAFQPEVKWILTGIRPGEKVHETLMTEDEARGAWEHESGYIISPHDNGLARVKEGFRYSSDTNTQWLTAEQLKSWLQSSVEFRPS